MNQEEPQVTDASITLLRTGEVKTQDWGTRPCQTAAVKTPHEGPARLTTTGFVGDEQGDLKHHGGEKEADGPHGAAAGEESAGRQFRSA